MKRTQHQQDDESRAISNREESSSSDTENHSVSLQPPALQFKANSSPTEESGETIPESPSTDTAQLQTSGEATPPPPPNNNEQVIQRGEAGVHHGIEHEAAGVDEGLSDETALEETYAGNWMRDFSQVNVPLVHNALAQIPTRIDGSDADSTIGGAGARDLSTGLLRALAMLEFGPEITNSLITEANIGVYTPEQHIDNSRGTRAEDHLYTNAQGEREQVPSDNPRVSGGWHSVHPEVNEQMQGSAISGLQAENELLYQVSSSGMGAHIYNSVEWTKDKLIRAMQAGPTQTGRMHLGTGLHAVEDYFAHSNFIEVCLNSEITRAISAQASGDTPSLPPTFIRVIQEESSPQEGSYVDTMYDARGEDGRQAITTGSFGGLDTRVSIAHVLLPQLPVLANLINTKTDQMLNWVASGQATNWAGFIEMLKGERAGLAFQEIVNPLDQHIQAPCYSMELTYGEIPVVGIRYPNGVEFPKEYKGLKQAFNHYAHIYRQVRDTVQTIRRIRDQIRRLLIFPAIVAALSALIETIQQKMRDAIEQLRNQIHVMINQMIFGIIQSITGLDIPEEKKRSIGDAVDWAHHYVEGMEHRSSLESRIANGELDQFRADRRSEIREQMQASGATPEQIQNEINSRNQEIEEEIQRVYGLDEDGNPITPLPPSHSEISKDHPPHEHTVDSHNIRCESHDHTHTIQGQGGGGAWTIEVSEPRFDEDGHMVEPGGMQARRRRPGEEHDEHQLSGGSLFYELHRQLALEADRHIMAKMHDVWAHNNPADGYTQGDVVNARPTLDRDEIMDQAVDQQLLEQRRAQQENRQFETGQDLNIPGGREVLALVDLFISHPDDNSWWRPIVQNYVNAHEAEVIAHIRARNQTRGHRQ